MRATIFIIITLLLTSCVKSNYKQCEGAVWGTTYHITYKSDRNLDDSIIAEMRKVELSLSMFDSCSTVSRINRRESDKADVMLLQILKLSSLVHKASRGAFDPTVAPLVDLWGFGRKGRETALPDSAAVAHVMQRVGFDKVTIDCNSITMPEGMELDFSAIAKGFGVDCVAAMLARNGCKDYMVEIGGEVSVSGKNPTGADWHIMIQDPTSGLIADDRAVNVLELTNCAVATSGNYRNYRNITTDSVVGHTIDPLTGYPKATSVVSVTVIAPTCALADALATSVMVADTSGVTKLIKSFPCTRAIIYVKDGEQIKAIYK